MLKILQCRRTFIAVLSIVCLTFIGYHKGIDVSMAIAAVSAAVASANAYEGSKRGS